MEGVAKDTTAVAAAALSSSEQSSSAEEKRIPAKQFMSVQRVQRADGIVLRTYESDSDMKVIMQMMERDLSEPYSIFTYRYFLWDWPDLTWVALDGERIIGSIVCEMKERKKTKRGYIAMLSVDPEYRRKGIAQDLVLQCLRVMKEAGCFMATLETEVINKNATNLYTKLGFLKDKLLVRYYLNGGDAWRLKLFFAAK